MDCVITGEFRVMEVDDADKPDKCPTKTSKPIYPLIGAERMSVEFGVSLSGYPLTWTYNTTRKLPTSTPDSGPVTSEPKLFGETGYGSFHRRLLYNPYTKSARVFRGNGDVLTFAPGPGGSFVSSSGVSDVLTRDGQGFRLVDAGAASMEFFDSDGRLTSIRRADGRTLTLAYSNAATPGSIAPAPGYLVSATDDFGRAINFSYEVPPGGAVTTDGRVYAVSSPSGQIALSYVGANLSMINWPDGRIRQFRYERPALPWAMTSVVDENGAQHATIGYDNSGRATSSSFSGGVGAHAVSYSEPPAITVSEAFDASLRLITRTRSWRAPVGTSMVLPNGSSSQLVASSINGMNKLTSQSQPAGSGCAASSRTQTFDINGNTASSDDFNGHRRCYVHHPTRNLELVRVEGLSGGVPGAACTEVASTGSGLPAGARKVSTEWHPDWSLKVTEAEPGRRTTYVYNGHPDPFSSGSTAYCAPSSGLLPDDKRIAVLCKQVEQATTDDDGSQGFGAAFQPGVPARIRTWTYNQFGQVLTETDPLNNKTTYEYYDDTAFTGTDPNAQGHTRGDLKQVTNAANQQTKYNKYNKSGQVLEIQDANNVLTTYTYDARQRLTSTSVGGQTTLREYWPTGLLKKVTQPDGVSFVQYTYDDAHRLRVVQDNLGSSITYTLDNMGNRTAEEVVDPGNSLRRQLTRNIDALGRVEQVTGRQ